MQLPEVSLFRFSSLALSILWFQNHSINFSSPFSTQDDKVGYSISRAGLNWHQKMSTSVCNLPFNFYQIVHFHQARDHFFLYNCHLETDAHRHRGTCTQSKSREMEQRLSVHQKTNLSSFILFIRLFSLLDRLRIAVAAGSVVTTDMPQQSGLIPSQHCTAYGVFDSSPSILEWQNLVQSTAQLGGSMSSSAAKSPGHSTHIPRRKLDFYHF